MADPARFDPYALLQALDRHRVSYVVIGGFARVIQGTEETTEGVDIVPSLREENLERLERALADLNGLPADGPDLELASLDETIVDLRTDHGDLKIVPTPAGTRGYDDLRRGANREPLGRGLRPQVASVGDLARMLSALDPEHRADELRQLRRLDELERGRIRTIER